MRIFLSCLQSQSKHTSVYAYQYWENYFKKGIEEAGYQWTEAEGVDWAEGLNYLDDKELKNVKEWRDRTWSAAIAAIKQQHQIKPIDFFLSYLFPQQVEPSAVREIQAMGIPCVNFFCDNIKFFGDNLPENAQLPKEYHCFDLHWVPEYKSLAQYQQTGLKYIHAPMAVWVPPDRRTCEHPENYGVCFIGSRDDLRKNLFARVIKLGADVELRGPGWSKAYPLPVYSKRASNNVWQKIVNQVDFVAKNGLQPVLWKATYKLQPKIPDSLFEKYVREPAYGADYVKITQQSVVTLGVNRYPTYGHSFYKPDTYSRLRDIEAPMLGACYLTEWTEGIDQLYEIGEEIETYRTAEEMVEKIAELKANPQKRKRMRCQAQKRALTEHSVPNTINKIIAALGLK